MLDILNIQLDHLKEENDMHHGCLIVLNRFAKVLA